MRRRRLIPRSVMVSVPCGSESQRQTCEVEHEMEICPKLPVVVTQAVRGATIFILLLLLFLPLFFTVLKSSPPFLSSYFSLSLLSALWISPLPPCSSSSQLHNYFLSFFSPPSLLSSTLSLPHSPTPLLFPFTLWLCFPPFLSLLLFSIILVLFLIFSDLI